MAGTGDDGTQSTRRAAQEILDRLASAYTDRPGVDRAAMFGSEAVRVGGKIVGFVTPEGELVVKVPPPRASALVEAGTAARMPIGGRPAREWLGVPLARSGLWADLLEESFAYVSGAYVSESATSPRRRSEA